MAWHRAVELPFRFAGRPVRPFHLGLCIATFATAWQAYAVDGNLATVLALASVVSAGFLLIGWVVWPPHKALSIWLTSWGALLSCGVWAARAAYVVLADEGVGVARAPVLSAILSVAWVCVAFGIWLIEQAEQDTLRDGGDGE